MSEAIPTTTDLYDLFERQARTRPDAPALRALSGEVGYAELEARAARLAARLARAGVGAGSVVGLLLPRSAHAVVGMLATLRLGAAYLPLDPAQPPARLAFMVATARAALVLTDGDREDVARGLGASVVRADAEGVPTSAEAPARARHDVAYVIFTSGSTGTPKGVPIRNEGVVNLLQGQTYADFGPGRTHLMLSSLGFDFSTLEIWGALLTGGTLALYEPVFVSLHDVTRHTRALGVTTLMMTPGLFHLLVGERALELHGVDHVLLGGDVPAPRLIRDFLRAAPGARVTNVYGPTENTVFTTCHTLHSPDFPEGPVPLGLPIPGTQALVMDSEGHALPPGEEGEIWLGGVGLTPGYLGRPDLDEAAFVRHPLA
ncbi:AMP-binding protein, partial [Deinococcus pimensis]|uniref:AMP-binding protein n=1 Tax=Deinococcus pimensis TaxID=309888 RepID=UPI00146F9AD0